jgi:hypothetical protein
MKYIKSFENSVDRMAIRLNDCVIIDNKYFVSNEYKKGKVIEIDKIDNFILVSMLDGNIWVKLDMIIRKLSFKECEDFEVEYLSKKYNL